MAAADAATRDWLAGQLALPDGMVDRITPATTGYDIGVLAVRTGLEDQGRARPEGCCQSNDNSSPPSADRAGTQSLCGERLPLSHPGSAFCRNSSSPRHWLGCSTGAVCMSKRIWG